MPVHQPIAVTPLAPIGPPIINPRSVSMIGVNGWYSANQRRPTGIDAVGTNPLPRNGSSVSGIGRLLAASALPATRPSATDSQLIANAVSTSRPAAESHATGPALDRKPTSSAIPMTAA